MPLSYDNRKWLLEEMSGCLAYKLHLARERRRQHIVGETCDIAAVYKERLSRISGGETTGAAAEASSCVVKSTLGHGVKLRPRTVACRYARRRA